MNFSIVISHKARDHTQKAYEYYESKQPSLGERFLATLELQYDKLKTNPHHYSFLSAQKDLRSLALPYFPFSIIFEINMTEVLIIDVHNTHSHPDNILNEPGL